VVPGTRLHLMIGLVSVVCRAAAAVRQVAMVATASWGAGRPT
jgi:hypothetical protein